MSNIKLPDNYNRVYAINAPLARGVLPQALAYITNNSMSNVKAGVYHRNTNNICG